MNYPHTATSTDPYAFSLWPETVASSEEEMMMWAQAAGGMVPAGDMLSHGVSLADATTATDTKAFAPASIAPFLADGIDTFAQELFIQSDFSNSLSSTPCRSPPPACKSTVLTQSKALTDASSFPPSQSEGTWDGFNPFRTSEGLPSYFVPPPGPSSLQLDIAGGLQPDQLTFAPSLRFMGDGNLAGQPPDYPARLDLMNIMSYPVKSGYTRAHDHITAPTEALTTMANSETVLPSSLGKRSRSSEESESGPQKRARPNATRVPGGAGPTKRTRRSPATTTQQNINSTSKAARIGAERLVSTTARGVYHRALPGLSVSQRLMGALEQGQSSWIEEREVEMWHHDTGSSGQQQIGLQSAENAEDGENLQEIPGNLSVRERSMLQTTQADEERGAIRVIRCKLCPKPRFSTWETFRRHCKSCEKHPSELRFCLKCGDYFGCQYSGVLHRKDKKYQKACLETSQDEAKEKKEKVERLLKEFEARLAHLV
ncbi:hypothetical protein BJY52DRAFT_1227927 [Lactarius psammicola]|nr:hypothetical protein BJY52DRAFT_1227927 [Lactarius psammicola]